MSFIAPWLDVPAHVRPLLEMVLDQIGGMSLDELSQNEVIAYARTGPSGPFVQVVILSTKDALEAAQAAGLLSVVDELKKPLVPGRARITVVGAGPAHYHAGLRLSMLAPGGIA